MNCLVECRLLLIFFEEHISRAFLQHQLLRQKVHQQISVIKTNTCDDIKNSSFCHFHSRFVLKTTKTTKTKVFV